MAVSDNYYSKLREVDVLQEQYFDQYLEQESDISTVDMKLLRMAAPGELEVVGDGLTFQVEQAPLDAARGSTTPLSAFSRSRTFIANKFKLRWSETGGSAHDFLRIDASGKTTDYELDTGGDGAIVNVARRSFDQMMVDANRKATIYNHAPKSGRLALINGTPKQNDTLNYAGAASTPTNTTGARFPVDNGSIAAFTAGIHIDIYDGATPVVQNVVVSDANTDASEYSVGVEYNTTPTDDASTGPGTLGDIADNNAIYFSGAYNQGMYGLAEWFARPTAGVTFIGGTDRLDPNYRWLNPIATREGATAAQLTSSHFYDAHQAMYLRHGGEARGKRVVFSTPAIIDRMMKVICEDNAINYATLEERQARYAVFGSQGVFWVSPLFGRVELIASPLMTPNRVYIIEPDSWRTAWYGQKPFKRMPGENGTNWSRVVDPATGSKTLYWETQLYGNFATINTRPSTNLAILNVTA